MVIAKIDYLNLLPFYIFLKRNLKSSRLKNSINYKKSYPSKLNRELKFRRVNGAFISSIASKKCKCTDAGIIGNGEVSSVFVFQNGNGDDIESATSNALAKVLNLKGEVSIGDKALKRYLAGEKGIDLATAWHNKYKLPFVFGRLCYNSNSKFFKKIAKKFVKRPIKIPQYILEEYSKSRNIPKKDILNYLTKISYKIGKKEKLSLQKFLKETRSIKR